jgi:transcriptional regulator with XRE-family HTH domain
MKKAVEKIVTVTKSHIDNSGNLFNALTARAEVKNDAGLARALGVAPPAISKIRHGKLTVGAALILAIHETFAMPVAEIRRLIAGGEYV